MNFMTLLLLLLPEQMSVDVDWEYEDITLERVGLSAWLPISSVYTLSLSVPRSFHSFACHYLVNLVSSPAHTYITSD